MPDNKRQVDSDSQVKLASLLRELGASAYGPMPGTIENRLRQACRQKRLRRRRLAGVVIGIAASLLLALGWEYRVMRQPPAVEAPMMQSENYTGFLALPYAQSDVPMEQAFIVRVSLQPSEIAGLGLPSSWRVGTRRRRAELLIGQDGIARAVRFTE